MTRTLPRTESWVSAWLKSFSRPTSEFLLDVMDEDGGAAFLARNGIDERDALVAGWPRLARTDMRLSYRQFLVKGFPFHGCRGAATVV
jgi:hypothetical protein